MLDNDPLHAVLAPPQAERLRDRLGLGPDAPVELATTGWCKVVVVAGDVAVLVPRNHEMVAPMRREVRALRVLGGVGLPGAPRLDEVIDDPAISPYPLAVVERVTGASLESVEPGLSNRRWREALHDVGAALALVHDRRRGDLDDRPPERHRAILHGLLDADATRRRQALATVAHELGTPSARLDTLVDALTPAAEMRDVVVHNDLHEAQVMIGPEGFTGLVDWQTASIAHPFVDFDVLQWGRGALARLNDGTVAHRRTMWEGYRGDDCYGLGTGDLLDLAWTLNDGWWAATQDRAPVTGFPLDHTLRRHLVEHARSALVARA
jgi:aminoglycoside phosphotransferase (APT) family kinase protein